MSEQPLTSGVQELIDRLSQDGVAHGEEQAEQIVSDARRKSEDILAAAQRQADEILARAREEADQLQAAGEDALKVACRDAQRDLAARLHDSFRNKLQQLVHHQVTDEKVLQQMILEIVHEAAPDPGDKIEVLLPHEVAKTDEIHKNLAAGEEDPLAELVKGILGEKIRDGFTIRQGSQDQQGLRVAVVDKNVEIDFSDQAMTELIARHLMPRFRAIMRS